MLQNTSGEDAPIDGNWKLVAFDLDDTLAPSKSPLPGPVGEALKALLDLVPVAVISGGALPQFELQLLGSLDASKTQSDHLHLLPTCGTQYLQFKDGELIQLYREGLSSEERDRATAALESVARELGFWEANPAGDIIEDRGSQITFSALGQKATPGSKAVWDPTGQKKNLLASRVQELLPDLEVRSGGSTSVDITAKGIDKAYGMARLAEQTGLAKEQMLFIGDRLDPAGNDYPVRAAGYPTISTTGWEDTARIVWELVDALKGAAAAEN